MEAPAELAASTPWAAPCAIETIDYMKRAWSKANAKRLAAIEAASRRRRRQPLPTEGRPRRRRRARIMA
jgi:hypothetical protein